MNHQRQHICIWKFPLVQLMCVCAIWGATTTRGEEPASGESAPPEASSISADPMSAAVPTEVHPAEMHPSMVFSPAPTSSLWDRETMLDDIGGFRAAAGSHGIATNFSTTQFYQGVMSGGIQEKFRFSGRNDILINVDGEKAGLWKGAFISLHGEARYGDGINTSTGALVPANSAILFPIPGDDTAALTGVKFTQALSESFVVFGGKINTLDELNQTYSAGRGVDAFMNLGLLFPMAAARTIPYSTLGAGFAVLEKGYPVFSFMALDTNNTPTTTGFESFFDNGVSLLAKLDVPVTIRGLPGHQSVWGSYSSGTYNNLQPTGYFDPSAGAIVSFGQSTGSWALFYSADQALYVDPCNPKRSWGLFTNLGIADNGPSPVRWSANVGLGGSSPLESRPLDTFGIGYAYTGYSDPVHDLAPDLSPVGNDHAVELFYNFAVTPWLRVTPDLQVLIPARERTLPPQPQSIDTALLFGLRAKIVF